MKNFWSALGLGLVLAGCATGGLPSNARVVGGGPQIEWNAPVAGTAILKEMTSGKILVTKSLDEQDKFEFTLDLANTEAIKALLGTNGLVQARFQLYFAPAVK